MGEGGCEGIRAYSATEADVVLVTNEDNLVRNGGGRDFVGEECIIGKMRSAARRPVVIEPSRNGNCPEVRGPSELGSFPGHGGEFQTIDVEMLSGPFFGGGSLREPEGQFS